MARCDLQIAGRHGVVETQREPGCRPETELRRKAVLKEVDLWAVEKAVASVRIELRHIRLLAGEWQGQQEKDTERNDDRPGFVRHKSLRWLAAFPRTLMSARNNRPGVDSRSRRIPRATHRITVRLQ